MHIEEIPFELTMSMNSSSVCGFIFTEHPEWVRGLLGREHGECSMGGHDTMDCETAFVGSITDLGQTSTGWVRGQAMLCSPLRIIMNGTGAR